MIFFKTSFFKTILKHVSIASGFGVLLVLFFFYIFLPSITNHGESITIPNLEGMPLKELDNFVVARDLRFEVSDSSYSEEYPPYTVLYQFPKAGSKVKAKRKIFISLNSKNPPNIQMPNLIDKTIQNAELILKSYELKRGKITTKTDMFRNVLEQKFNGKPIKKGTKIPKGSEIDLVIGNGHGIIRFEMPSLLGLSLEDAEIIIKGNSLNMGIVFNNKKGVLDNFVVIKQSPQEGKIVRIASEVNIWLGNAIEPSTTTLVD